MRGKHGECLFAPPSLSNDSQFHSSLSIRCTCVLWGWIPVVATVIPAQQRRCVSILSFRIGYPWADVVSIDLFFFFLFYIVFLATWLKTGSSSLWVRITYPHALSLWQNTQGKQANGWNVGFRSWFRSLGPQWWVGHSLSARILVARKEDKAIYRKRPGKIQQLQGQRPINYWCMIHHFYL